MKTDPHNYTELSNEALGKLTVPRLNGLRKKMLIIESKLTKEQE